MAHSCHDSTGISRTDASDALASSARKEPSSLSPLRTAVVKFFRAVVTIIRVTADNPLVCLSPLLLMLFVLDLFHRIELLDSSNATVMSGYNASTDVKSGSLTSITDVKAYTITLTIAIMFAAAAWPFTRIRLTMFVAHLEKVLGHSPIMDSLSRTALFNKAFLVENSVSHGGQPALARYDSLKKIVLENAPEGGYGHLSQAIAQSRYPGSSHPMAATRRQKAQSLMQKLGPNRESPGKVWIHKLREADIKRGDFGSRVSITATEVASSSKHDLLETPDFHDTAFYVDSFNAMPIDEQSKFLCLTSTSIHYSIAADFVCGQSDEAILKFGADGTLVSSFRGSARHVSYVNRTSQVDSCVASYERPVAHAVLTQILSFCVLVPCIFLQFLQLCKFDTLFPSSCALFLLLLATCTLVRRIRTTETVVGMFKVHNEPFREHRVVQVFVMTHHLVGFPAEMVLDRMNKDLSSVDTVLTQYIPPLLTSSINSYLAVATSRRLSSGVQVPGHLCGYLGSSSEYFIPDVMVDIANTQIRPHLPPIGLLNHPSVNTQHVVQLLKRDHAEVYNQVLGLGELTTPQHTMTGTFAVALSLSFAQDNLSRASTSRMMVPAPLYMPVPQISVADPTYDYKAKPMQIRFVMNEIIGNAAYGHVRCAANLRDSIEKRIKIPSAMASEKVSHVIGTPLETELLQKADHFGTWFLAKYNSGSGLFRMSEYEFLALRSNKQLLLINEQYPFTDDPIRSQCKEGSVRGEGSVFSKTEVSSDPTKDSRNIACPNPAYQVCGGRFALAISRLMKQFKCVAMGKTQVELLESVEELHAYADSLSHDRSHWVSSPAQEGSVGNPDVVQFTTTDYSRFDACHNELTRRVVSKIWSTWFAECELADLHDLLEQDARLRFAARGLGTSVKSLIKYVLASGTPLTSVMNTILNMFANFLANTLRFPTLSWDDCLVHLDEGTRILGDDCAMCWGSHKASVEAATMLGLSLDISVTPDEVIEFLAQDFVGLGVGNPQSYPNLLRWLSRFPTTIRPIEVSNSEVILQKCLCTFSIHSRTPLVTPFVLALGKIHLNTSDRKAELVRVYQALQKDSDLSRTVNYQAYMSCVADQSVTTRFLSAIQKPPVYDKCLEDKMFLRFARECPTSDLQLLKSWSDSVLLCSQISDLPKFMHSLPKIAELRPVYDLANYAKVVNFGGFGVNSTYTYIPPDYDAPKVSCGEKPQIDAPTDIQAVPVAVPVGPPTPLSIPPTPAVATPDSVASPCSVIVKPPTPSRKAPSSVGMMSASSSVTTLCPIVSGAEPIQLRLERPVPGRKIHSMASQCSDSLLNRPTQKGRVITSRHAVIFKSESVPRASKKPTIAKTVPRALVHAKKKGPPSRLPSAKKKPVKPPVVASQAVTAPTNPESGGSGTALV